MNDRERKKIIDKIGELKRNLKYRLSMTEEEKVSLQMQIDSLERRINAERNPNVNIFQTDYQLMGKTSNPNIDIFSPEKNDLTKEQIKEILDGGYDFGVPRPEKPEPCYSYYRYNKVCKK